MKVDEIDDIFNMVDKIMKEHFYGGYSRELKDNYEETGEDDTSDIYEDAKHIYITMELRGIQEEDIMVTIEPYKLILQVLYNGKMIEQELKLPCKVKTKGKINFNNYVLDVILTKDKRKKNGKKTTGRTTN